MKSRRIKSIMFGLFAMSMLVIPLKANAGTTVKANHPYTQYTYSTHFNSEDANGSYQPGGSVATTSLSHEHTLVWEDDNGNAVVDCTHNTTKHLRCKTCNYSFPRGIVSYLPVGHQYNEASWVIDKEPTCTEPGVKHQVCRICGGGEINQGTVIPATGHSYSDATKKKNGGVKIEPTCEKDGSYYQICDKCGNVDKTKFNTVKGTKLSHEFEFGKCIKCGKYVDNIWGFLRNLFD